MTVNAESYFKFKRAAPKCLVCGVELTAMERHPTGLKIAEEDNTIREDICPKCWGEMGHQEYFSYWITRRYQDGPTAEQRRLAKAERNEALWRLLNAMYAQERGELGPQLFLITHLLMKYRVLSYQGRTEDGKLRFLHGPTQETFEVEDVPLESVSFVDIKQIVDKQLHEYAPPPES